MRSESKTNLADERIAQNLNAQLSAWRKPRIVRLDIKRTLVGQGPYDDGQTEAGTLDIS